MSGYDLALFGAGYGLAIASTAMGDTIRRGPIGSRPAKPAVFNAITSMAAISASIATVAGFFLYGWAWLGVMLAAIVLSAVVLLPLGRTIGTAVVTGGLGTLLLLLGVLER